VSSEIESAVVSSPTVVRLMEVPFQNSLMSVTLIAVVQRKIVAGAERLVPSQGQPSCS
jgi:hypothetical protein